tara:strand:+ start:365 stop:676 length:312 start_codon:yes stop_codon:yes gene_type:complete
MTASTGYERDNTGAFIRKDPESVLDYTINWSDFLTTGDTISSATYTVDTGLTKDSNSNTTTTTTVTLSGGTAGTVYTVKCVIATAASRTVARRFRVKCEELHL